MSSVVLAWEWPSRLATVQTMLLRAIQEPRCLLLADVLRVAIGAFQKRRVGVPQQVGGHLLACAVFQQIGGEKVPHRVQVVIFRESVAVIHLV